MSDAEMIDEWLKPNTAVPVDLATVGILLFEIERLRHDWAVACKALGEARAELDEAKEIGNRLIIETCVKQTEIERHMREKVALAALVSKERDDNERLRTALQPMIEHFSVGGGKTPIGKMLDEARAALEPKP